MSTLNKKKTVQKDEKRKGNIIRNKILSNPDQYLRSVDRKEGDMWIYKSGSMLYKHISYIPVFSNNKTTTSEPILSKCKATDKWTEIKFKPDLARFNMTSLEEDTVGLVKRKVVDIAGCMGKTVDVKLDGKKIPLKSFPDLTLDNGWEFWVIPSDGHFRQASFVNGIATVKGGTHVDYLTDLVDFLERVENPKVVQRLLSLTHPKASKDLTGGSTKRKGIINIPKLEDATRDELNSEDRTLTLTEGDSSLAVAGLSVVGRENYGVFPLRCKLLNARGATDEKISNNQEIKDVMEILGLVPGQEYNSLIINMLHVLWPSLLSIPSFLLEFRTPIVKATRKNPIEVLLFYSMEEFKAWSAGKNKKGWRMKHYKGLGSSTSKESIEYFKDPDKSIRKYHCLIDTDATALDLAFNKTRADERKVWIDDYMLQNSINEEGGVMQVSDFIDMDKGHQERMEGYQESMERYQERLEDELEDGMTSVSHFVDTELVQFSAANLQRNIPSMVDGLKPTQRKILFTRVYVANYTCYHHGEVGLNQTIIGMSRDYVGSNNIPLLQADGQFGTRRGGGEDKAKARYPQTCLSGITRYLFPFGDDICLDCKNENGRFIEPTWYTPVIPTILVNGSVGAGTGYSTFVPNYLPSDIIANVRRLLKDEPMIPMIPGCVGYGGSIEKGTEAGTFTSKGIIKRIDSKTLEICELPIRIWTEDYCEKNKNISTDDDMVKLKIVSIDELSEEQEAELLEKFDLITTFSITNMKSFDICGRIKEYKSPEEILQEYYHVTLRLCEASFPSQTRQGRVLDIDKWEPSDYDQPFGYLLSVNLNGVSDGDFNELCDMKKKIESELERLK
ncbi:hypothetical protein MKW98_020192, partial [Papaver atlanticum]